MNMSHKWTFSLASLILLVAFAAVPVMAHGPESAETVGPHTHPVTVAVDAASADPNTVPPTPAVLAVPIHGPHPTAEITLKSGQANVRGDKVAVIADDTATTDVSENTFTLLVTFDIDVVNTASQATIASDFTDIANGDLEATDFTFSSLRSDNVAAGSNVPTLTIVRVNDGAASPAIVAAGKKQFEVTVAIGDFPTGTAGDLAEELTFRIRLNDNATGNAGVFGLQTTELAPNGIETVTVPGGGNLQSSTLTLTLVKELPELPPTPDTDKPTLTITHSPDDKTELPESGNVTFTFTFNEALGSNDNGFSSSDIVVENGSIADFGGSGMVYTAEITPTDPMVDVKVTVAADKVADAAGNNLAEAVSEIYEADDTENPTVVITSARGTGDDAGKIIVTFTFSEPLREKGGTYKPAYAAGDEFTSEDIDRTQSNVLIAGEPTKSTTDDKVYTLKVTPPATGSATIVLKTGSVTDLQGNKLQGDQSHTYTPTPAETPATITAPADTANAGNTAAGQQVTVTFDKDPGTVTAMIGTTSLTVAGTGTSRMIMIPAGQAEGSVAIALEWDIGGSGTVTYTIPGSANPTAPANISAPIEIPANSYVVVVRDKAAVANLSDALNFPMVDGKDVMVKEWMDMPDLEALFNRSSYGQGGALVLRKSEDAVDNDNAAGTGTYATPGLGSVGISEIMWALDLGQVNRDKWKVGQWIELHNLNSKPVKVLLYAQTARELVSDQLVNMTAAGDSIAGALRGNVLDVVQNINDRGEQTRGGWDLPGKSGNSRTGENLIGAHRILPHNQPAYSAAQNYTKRDGRNKDHWRAASNVYISSETRRSLNQVTTVVVADYLGTPGSRNNYTGVTLLNPDGRTGVPANRIVFNEVANRSNANKAYEWIELRNVTGGTVNLKNYIISAVTAVGTDTEIIKFAGDLNVPAGGILLVLASDPVYNRNHPIHIGTGVQHTVQTFKGNGLPDGGNFVLFLRGRADNKPDGIGTGKPDHVLDIAGYHSGLHKASYTNAISSTNLWPLKSFEAPASAHNRFDTDTVHYRQHVRSAAGQSGVGTTHGAKHAHQVAFREQGYTGVGYKRLSATIAAHGGTPGYPNAGGSYQSSGATVKSSVYISEIMYADNKAGVLPQWIELRNTSKSVGVNLHDARLTITNHADTADGDWKGKGVGSVMLRNMRIKPNSSVLIASRRAVQRLDVSTVHMPSTDIFILWNVDKGAFGMTTVNDDVINPHGFKIHLEAKVGNAWQTLDVASNLDSAAKDSRGRSDERYADPLWTWPAAIQDETGYRISVVRNAWRKTPTSDMTIAKGTSDWGWELSTEDPGHSRVAAITYYGDITDISTPGLTHGQPLPVELSYFRPTLENGQVTIQWTTESELDNAGFNILRSETRDGEFTKVNEQMIQGKGTTAERSTYKWVDTTAKPGVVYYYQIEDVSFAGEHTQLATTKLKGLISAKGKLTTQWGNLKNLR